MTDEEELAAEYGRWDGGGLPGACRELVYLRKELKAFDGQLRELLAVIHRDGGHHTDAVGVEQSVKDAVRRWVEMREQLDLLQVQEPLRPKYILPAKSLIDGRALLGFWYVPHPVDRSRYLWADGTWRVGCGQTAGERNEGNGHYETCTDAIKAIAALKEKET